MIKFSEHLENLIGQSVGVTLHSGQSIFGILEETTCDDSEKLSGIVVSSWGWMSIEIVIRINKWNGKRKDEYENIGKGTPVMPDAKVRPIEDSDREL
jgi:small nuclear ribonucleoprotein (snRNP)-like protein